MRSSDVRARLSTHNPLLLIVGVCSWIKGHHVTVSMGRVTYLTPVPVGPAAAPQSRTFRLIRATQEEDNKPPKPVRQLQPVSHSALAPRQRRDARHVTQLRSGQRASGWHCRAFSPPDKFDGGSRLFAEGVEALTERDA